MCRLSRGHTLVDTLAVGDIAAPLATLRPPCLCTLLVLVIVDLQLQDCVPSLVLPLASLLGAVAECDVRK